MRCSIGLRLVVLALSVILVEGMPARAADIPLIPLKAPPLPLLPSPWTGASSPAVRLARKLRPAVIVPCELRPL